MIRRILEAAASPLTLGFAVVAFLPIVFGTHSLYEWTHGEVVAADAILTHKKPWLNTTSFLTRSAVYFALWIFFAWVLSRLSARQDETGDRQPRPLDAALGRRRPRRLSPLDDVRGVRLAHVADAALVLHDLRSLRDHRAGRRGDGLRGARSRLVLGEGPSPAVPFQPRHLHDYGKLLFAFVCVWAYFAYSQFIIIWSGNLPEETTFYTSRMNGAWRATTIVLVLLHYALPFALLLSRDRKRSAKALAPVAVLLLFARWLDLHWLVAPVILEGRVHDPLARPRRAPRPRRHLALPLHPRPEGAAAPAGERAVPQGGARP